MRKFTALAVVAIVALALGLIAPATASAPSAASRSCSWSEWRSYTDEIGTGGNSRFRGTVYFKVEICNGERSRTKVGAFYVSQKITGTAYPGITHTIEDARHIRNDIAHASWLDGTNHSCTDVCEIDPIYQVDNIVSFHQNNQVAVFCRACNAGGQGGETTTMYYIAREITCEGTAFAC